MSVLRIVVAWMKSVPINDEGQDDYDHAVWDRVEVRDAESARVKAQVIANSNPWGQAWIYFDSAPRDNSPEWKWEMDYEATEIISAQCN